jgi:hypothetical protein
MTDTRVEAADVLDRLAAAHLEVGCRAFGDGSMTDYLCDLADEIKILRNKNAHLQFCLNSRDEFLVNTDQWSAYTDTLPRKKAGVARGRGWSETPPPASEPAGAKSRDNYVSAQECAALLRAWAKAYRDAPEHRFPSDPHAEFFPQDLESAAQELEREPAGAPTEVLLTGVHPYGKPLRDK